MKKYEDTDIVVINNTFKLHTKLKIAFA